MASYLQDYLNDGEDWIIFAQVFHSDYNSVTYDVPAVEGYVNLSIPNTTLTVYEGDVVYLYFGAMDDSDFIETPHTGMTTTASLTLEGLDSSDISTINFGTEAEGVTLNGETLVVAIDDAYFVSSIGVRIQTGGDDYEVLTNAATDTSFILYNNGEDDGVQLLDISAILYNPEYDILEDQLQSVVSSGQITYIDHADVTKDDLPWNTSRFDYGNGHDNRMRGTGGDDALDGRGGNDILKGHGGNDDLVGGAGRDTLYGGAGNDRLSGGKGKDTLDGGAHDDELYGGQHDDILKGGAGLDKLYGGDGDDSLQGNGGNDWLYGGSGDDTLNGGDGDDLLDGGADYDYLYGGLGADSLYGDGDAAESSYDTFIFKSFEESRSGDGNRDTIYDFEQGNDVIDLSEIVISDGANVELVLQEWNGEGYDENFYYVAGDGDSSADVIIHVVFDGTDTHIIADYAADYLGVGTADTSLDADFEILLKGEFELDRYDFYLSFFGDAA